MLGGELLELRQEVLSRFRFFGLGLLARIGSRLAPLVMPYDERLEIRLAGSAERGRISRRVRFGTSLRWCCRNTRTGQQISIEER